MNNLNISPNFTQADIHKIRQWHYEQTKDMTRSERRDYYKGGFAEFAEFAKGVEKRAKATTTPQ